MLLVPVPVLFEKSRIQIQIVADFRIRIYTIHLDPQHWFINIIRN